MGALRLPAHCILNPAKLALGMRERVEAAGVVVSERGFNGEGVVMTQLAGLILSDLVAGETSALTRLPLVEKRMPWLPPEPFRSAGVRLYEQLLLRTGANPLR